MNRKSSFPVAFGGILAALADLFMSVRTMAVGVLFSVKCL